MTAAARLRRLVLVVASGVGLAAATPSAAETAAEFYRGKTVTVTYPTGPGGSFHLYAELIRRHLPRYIPGEPTMIVQNRPGAGGLTMNQYMAQVAPRDGTVIAEINPGTLSLPLLRSVQFDPREYEWLGSVAVRSYVGALWHTVEADTIDKMKTTEVIMGAAGTTSLGYHIPALMNAVLGTRFKLITGYPGGADINLAIERGEVHGRANYYDGFTSATPQWIRDKKLKFFFVMGRPPAELAAVPRLSDVMTGAEERQMLSLLEVSVDVGQAFFLPPGTPRDRVEALRAAFDKVLKDPAFLAEAKEKDLLIDPRTHAEVRAAIEKSYRTPPAVAKKLAGLIGLDKPGN